MKRSKEELQELYYNYSVLLKEYTAVTRQSQFSKENLTYAEGLLKEIKDSPLACLPEIESLGKQMFPRFSASARGYSPAEGCYRDVELPVPEAVSAFELVYQVFDPEFRDLIWAPEVTRKVSVPTLTLAVAAMVPEPLAYAESFVSWEYGIGETLGWDHPMIDALAMHPLSSAEKAERKVDFNQKFRDFAQAWLDDWGLVTGSYKLSGDSLTLGLELTSESYTKTSPRFLDVKVNSNVTSFSSGASLVDEVGLEDAQKIQEALG